jgi:two-component system CheB/CheR fusion protein
VENVIDGVVINFTDIHGQKKAAEKFGKLNQALKESRQMYENILNTVREPLLVLDKALKIISANRSFYKTFDASPSETEKHFIYNLGDGQWDIPQLRVLLEEIIPRSNSFEDFEVEHAFPKIGHRKMLLNARRVFGEKISEERILLAMEDVTGKS